MSLGIVEQDVINLIEYQKMLKKGLKPSGPMLNSLCMADDFYFHTAWSEVVNPELYWEMQYLWVKDWYFHTGVFKKNAELAWNGFKVFSIKTYKPTIVKLSYYYITWLLWGVIVGINYRLYVTLPYQIRNG